MLFVSVMLQHQNNRRGDPLRTADENRHASHCNAYVKLEHRNCTAVYKPSSSVHTQTWQTAAVFCQNLCSKFC